MDLIDSGREWLLASGLVEGHLDAGPLRSLLVRRRASKGVGSVVVFLPQI